MALSDSAYARTSSKSSGRGAALTSWALVGVLWPALAAAQTTADGIAPVAVRPPTPPLQVEVRARALLEHSEQSGSLASSVLRGARLTAPGASSAEVLARVPGVQVNRTGAQSDLATASVRGSDAQQIPVYVAGIRLNDDVTGTADLSTVPLWMMDRVEVFRGNAPERADQLGLGGAIFFWPRLPKRARLGAGAEVGSFAARSGWLSGEVGGTQAGSLVAVRQSSADNDYPFVDDRGQRFDRDEQQSRRVNADFQQTEAWAISRYALARRTRLQTVVHAFDRTQGVTGLSAIPARRTRASTRRFLAGTTVTLPCSGRAGSCNAELGTSLLAGSVQIVDPRLELPGLLARAVDNQGERITTSLRVANDWTQAVSTHAGAQLAFENVRLDRAGSSGVRGARRSLRPTLGVQGRPSAHWTVHALGALECHSTSGNSVRLQVNVERHEEGCTLLEPVGRLGARYELAWGVELLSNVGRYVRLPTLSELYGNSPLIQGNPALEPEKGVSLDAGARWSGQLGPAAWAFEAFAFVRTVDALIRFRRTSFETLAPFNVARARFAGIELAGASDLAGHLRLEGNASLLDARETTNNPALDPTVNDLLPLTARLTASTLLEVHQEPFASAVSRVSAGLRHFYRSSRFDDPAGLTVLPEQHFFDFEATVRWRRPDLALRLAARNLLDAHSRDLLGLPVPGRSYHANMEVWF